MFQFKRDFQQVYCGARSVELSRQLNPWLAVNKDRIPLE
jgi:hypothetical protein